MADPGDSAAGGVGAAKPAAGAKMRADKASVTAKPVKFLFAQEFEKPNRRDEPAEPVLPEPEPDPLLYTDADLAAAMAAARAEGEVAGRAAALAAIAAWTDQTLTAIAERLATIQQAGTVTRGEAEHAAAGFAHAIARKLAHSLIEREPQAEIERMVVDCLHELARETREARVVVRVPEPLATAIDEHAAKLAARGGFLGQVVVVGDAALQNSDCRVEWTDGGAERDMAALEAEIDTAVARYLAARETAPAGDDETTQ